MAMTGNLNISGVPVIANATVPPGTVIAVNANAISLDREKDKKFAMDVLNALYAHGELTLDDRQALIRHDRTGLEFTSQLALDHPEHVVQMIEDAVQELEDIQLPSAYDVAVRKTKPTERPFLAEFKDELGF
jgi:2-hydroxychromene-2-carboxylate isomerase